MGKHTAPTTDSINLIHSTPDAYEVEEVADVLRSLPLYGEELGEGGRSDWALSILTVLAGSADADVVEYLTPRILAGARKALDDWGFDKF